MKLTTLLVCSVILCTACGGGGGEVDARRGFDAANRTDRVYVVKQVTLPATAEDVDASKFEFPGSGYPVNKLGALLQVLMGLLEGVPVQDELDANYLAGEALQLFIVRSGDLTDQDPGVTGSFAAVDDYDDPADPDNNWGGQGQFVLRTGRTLEPLWSNGSLAGGTVEANGTAEILYTFLLPFFAGEEEIGSRGCYPQIRAAITEDGLVGAAANAVTPEEFDATVLPLAARLLTRAISEDQPQKAQIKALFDDNDDDEVTVLELQSSDTMATLSQPDVDLDGDSALDHLSQGILFEAVRAELVTE